MKMQNCSFEPKLSIGTRLRLRLLRAYFQPAEFKEPGEITLKQLVRLPRKSLMQENIEYKEVEILAKGTVRVEVHIKLGWWDLLRCAFGCLLFVRTQVYTEHVPGNTKAVTDVFPIAMNLK